MILYSLTILLRTVHCLYYNPGSVKAAEIAHEGRSRGVACEELSRPGLDSLCRQADRYKEHHVHQGIVADVSRLRYVALLFIITVPIITCCRYYPLDYSVPQHSPPPLPPSSLVPAPSVPVWVLLCSVRDPGNLGAIIRSCYFLGVSRLLVTGARCQLSSVVSKSSSGTLELVPVYSVRNALDLVTEKREEGWRVMAADIPDYFTNIDEDDNQTETSTTNHPDLICHSVDDLSVTSMTPSLLVLGSEGAGIPQDLLSNIKERVFVRSGSHVHASVDSLNVSVATGIILHKLCQNSRNK